MEVESSASSPGLFTPVPLREEAGFILMTLFVTKFGRFL
jgi:hypothetical protein